MKKVNFILGLIMLSCSVSGQIYTPFPIGAEEQAVSKLLKIIQAYSGSSSEARSVGLYQLDSLLQGSLEEASEPGPFSEVNYKSNYTYTNRGYPDEALFYYWDGMSFQLYSRYAFEFSLDGKIEHFLWQYWDFASSEWVDYVQNIFHYNSKRQLQEDIYLKANYLKILEPLTRILYQYDTVGNLVSKLEQRYFNGQWMNHYEQTYLYSVEAHLLSNSSWTYEGREEPLELKRINYAYNQKHQNVGIQRLTFNYLNNMLSIEEMDTFIYDSQNRLSEEIQFQYPLADGWVLITKTEYSYGESNIPFAIRNFYLNGFESWDILSQSEIELDQNQDISAITLFSSSEDHLKLQPRFEYQYDRNEKIKLVNLNLGSAIWLDSWVFKDLTFQGAEKGTYAINQYGLFDWDSDQGVWVNTDEAGSLFFFYSSNTATSGREEVKSPSLLVYPNPTNRLIFIETDLSAPSFDLFLYDMNGRCLFRKTMVGHEQLMLPALPEGIYMLHLCKGREIVGSRSIIIRY